ncbi:FYVE zinc finger-domain-containing protein [Trametes meyenii]|nr:FYVE zinc finger-domain-containing protein [Trametes meyenii]
MPAQRYHSPCAVVLRTLNIPQGYLDIVRWLCEHGGATSEVDGAPGVDVRSKGGWTPLMNAASKGHLPVVLYLLTKQTADPLVRNNWGETAYDVASAVFEVWICEVLQRFEADKWRNSAVPYNPLAVHTTIPLVLHENQRLDVRLKTLAVSGGRPKFSASGLGRRGQRAPFELVLPSPTETSGKRIGAWRSDVQLPLLEDPFTMPKPGSSQEGADRSHFWLSDWTLDVTPPGVDAQDGWQYAHSFTDPDDQWVSEPPPQLERLLSGSGAVAAGLGGSSRSRSSSRASSSSSSHPPQTWVRRRRWVRVMRRRLDIPPLPFLQPDGAMYHLADGQLVPFLDYDGSDFGGSDGQELGAMPSSGLASQDYVARARYLVGTPQPDSRDADSALEARRMIAKLERATNELSQGILSDDDSERKIQAEVLLNAYNRELERRRLAAGAQGLLISGDDDQDFDDDDDDEEFHYPGAPSPPLTARPPSLRSTTTDYFTRASGSGTPRNLVDLTPHLSQAPEFRVPTHEAPQKVLTPRWTAPTPHQVHAQWERDETVSECRECRRRFTFLNRRHCRRCGRIFCDRCSSYRALLDPSDTVHDPSFPESSLVATQQRVCQSCYEQVTATVPNGLHTSRTTSMERIFIDQRRLSIPSPTRAQSSSQLSDLAECPVCNTSLNDLGPAEVQEAHVKNCLEGGSGKAPQSAKYLVYKLPAESALIGTECVICLEEFVQGSTVARLSCLCSFHNACLSSWLQRGRSCPVHAR